MILQERYNQTSTASNNYSPLQNWSSINCVKNCVSQRFPPAPKNKNRSSRGVPKNLLCFLQPLIDISKSVQVSIIYVVPIHKSGPILMLLLINCRPMSTLSALSNSTKISHFFTVYCVYDTHSGQYTIIRYALVAQLDGLLCPIKCS